MMLWALLTSPSWGWTCTEATQIWAVEPQESRAQSRLRSGWQYTPEELKCMVAGGVPQHVVDQLRPHHDLPFEQEIKGELHTVVLDLGCGALVVSGSDGPNLKLSGYSSSGASLPFQVTDGIATVRRPEAGSVTSMCTQLEVEAPEGARLLIYHRGAHVHVRGMKAAVEITAAEANVIVEGDTPLVEVDSLKGDVLVDITGSVEVEAGEGNVMVAAGAGATVRTTTVSGNQFIWGGPLRRLYAGTVEGDIRSQAAWQPSAVVEARSHSGDVLIGISESQAALAPMPQSTPPPVLSGGVSGSSMRPGRTLPDGTSNSGACFDCLPGEIRHLWDPSPPSRSSLSTGAKVTFAGTEFSHAVRIRAESLTGTSATPVLGRPPAPASAYILLALEAQTAKSLGACRPDLAAPPAAGSVDLWAHLTFNKSAVQTVTFNVDGFDQRLVDCLHGAMSKWTVPNPGPIEVDWPMHLLVVRSPPP